MYHNNCNIAHYYRHIQQCEFSMKILSPYRRFDSGIPDAPEGVFEHSFPPDVLSLLRKMQMAGMNFQIRSSTALRKFQ